MSDDDFLEASCSTCIFWDKVFHEGRFMGSGRCRFSAPVISDAYLRSDHTTYDDDGKVCDVQKMNSQYLEGVWPCTDQEDWCGNFRQRKERPAEVSVSCDRGPAGVRE
jgi:hypothetical protein